MPINREQFLIPLLCTGRTMDTLSLSEKYAFLKHSLIMKVTSLITCVPILTIVEEFRFYSSSWTTLWPNCTVHLFYRHTFYWKTKETNYRFNNIYILIQTITTRRITDNEEACNTCSLALRTLFLPVERLEFHIPRLNFCRYTVLS